ncbi:MAG: FKBP-type peptidyl-prolyl cis-trans isomerase [Treponema sp.]|jgi:FKBP-type peptidyl-prolyl cis-trans isomerase FkpA|nr:FKBP-type peptidyl-prolyl cis-trans isomerase [Treponema sp.]
MIKKAFLAIILATTVLLACNAGAKSEKTAGAPQTTGASSGTSDPDTSYAFGVALGHDLQDAGLRFDYDAFVKGFSDVLEGKETKFTLDEAVQKINEAYIAALKQKEADFLAENKQKNGVTETDSGLQYEVLTEGTGPKPSASSTVEVHYEGALTDGTVFDSSYERGGPASFTLEDMIPGWIEGIQLMNQGGVYRFFIPSRLAYGEQGVSGVIMPYAVLIFKVELLSVK